MAAGDYITKANYRSMYTGSSWEITKSYSASEASHKYLWYKGIYLYATSFVLLINVTQEWFAAVYMDYDVYFYNESSGTWTLFRSGTVYTKATGTTNPNFLMTHNRDSTEFSLVNKDVADISNNHLWYITIKVDYDQTSGNENNYDAYVQIRAGATEMVDYTDTSCDFLWKTGEKIYGFVPAVSTDSSRSPSGHPNPKGNYAGNPISVSSGTARYIHSYG